MSDETITELARLLAEATRARRLAEAAAMDERCGTRAFQRNQAADEARRVAEQRGDELKAAQAQIAELRAKLDQAERERDEARGEAEKLRADCAQISGANADLRRELAEARTALAAAHEHDAAEVARLRGLIGEVLDRWDAIDDSHGDLYSTARRAARGES